MTLYDETAATLLQTEPQLFLDGWQRSPTLNLGLIQTLILTCHFLTITLGK